VKVLVVGGSGMLGSALVSVLSKNASLELYATYRTPCGQVAVAGVSKWFMFRAGEPLRPSLEIGAGDWILNAAGLIRHKMREGSPEESAEAIRVNSLLPYELAQVCHRTGASMIHFTTDCVFSGKSLGTQLNRYLERDHHDASDLYGRSKSMGEVRGFNRVFNVRCSIVGPEPKSAVSLLGWFLSQPGDSVAGHLDHLWNGVTTLALAKVVEGILLAGEDDLQLPDLHHLVPEGSVSKAKLLALFSVHFRRGVKVEDRRVGGIDRTLGTSQQDLNNRLWAMAGYEKPPRIEEMVEELARWVPAGYLFRKEAAQ
jgi:dTDP-4-dehydrorhamnose reductase